MIRHDERDEHALLGLLRSARVVAQSRATHGGEGQVFAAREQLYIGWVGLRGAVPIFLAIIPVISPGPITVSFFNVVFVIVVTSLLLQGWTISARARWLGVAAEAPAQVALATPAGRG